MDMTPAAGRLAATLLAAALALAGCAVAHPAATAAGHPATAATAATAAAQPAAAAALPPRERAEADAVAILAAFVVPPGARKLPVPPAGQASVLKHIAASPASPNWIDKTGFWQVKGDPQQVLTWTAGHVGRSHSGGGVITNLPTSSQPETVWERVYTFPPVYGLEDTRELTVETADAGGGQTAVRVDAQVTWLPARTASEMVPAAATAVTLSLIPDPGLSKKAPTRPATATGPEAVRRITAMVNALPTFPPGQLECGLGRGEVSALVLTFLSAPHGKVLATAYLNVEGCQPAFLAVGSARITSDTRTWSAPGVTELGVPYQGRAFAAAILKAAGSNWTLGAYMPMMPS